MFTWKTVTFHVDRCSGNNTGDGNKREQRSELHSYQGSRMMRGKDGGHHSFYILMRSSSEARMTAQDMTARSCCL